MVGSDGQPSLLVPSSGMPLHEVPHDLVVHEAVRKVLVRWPMTIIAGACHKLISSQAISQHVAGPIVPTHSIIHHCGICPDRGAAHSLLVKAEHILFLHDIKMPRSQYRIVWPFFTRNRNSQTVGKCSIVEAVKVYD